MYFLFVIVQVYIWSYIFLSKLFYNLNWLKIFLLIINIFLNFFFSLIVSDNNIGEKGAYELFKGI
jgi:hypothetical protein